MLGCRMLLCILPSVIFIFFASAVTAQEPQGQSLIGPARVMIMPFAVHSKDDLSSLRRQVLNTIASGVEANRMTQVIGIDRLKRLVLEEKVSLFDDAIAVKIGREEGAQFAILGSITKIEKDISIDMRLLNISNGTLLSFFYIKGASET